MVSAIEGCFADAEGGEVEAPTDVGGEAEGAGVTDTVSIDEDDIGGVVELFKGAKEQGGFAKGEKAGVVGEFGGVDVGCFFDDLVGLCVVEDDSGVGDGVVLVVGDIGGGDEMGAFGIEGEDKKLLGELGLALFGGFDIEGEVFFAKDAHN